MFLKKLTKHQTDTCRHRDIKRDIFREKARERKKETETEEEKDTG